MKVSNDSQMLPREVYGAVPLIRNCLGTALLGIYLHGSAVSGGLRPRSDVDLLVIVSRPLTDAERSRLVQALLEVSGRYPHDALGRRPIELIVFARADLAVPSFPARSQFVYGEWLRDQFEAGEVSKPTSDPELTLLLAQARRDAQTLIGPALAEVLPIIPESDVRRAIAEALPSLLRSLEGDERNVLLTLARMWRTLATAEFVSKEVAAQWALPNLSDAAATMLTAARDEYLSVTDFDWSARCQDVGKAADELAQRVAALLS